MNWDDYSVRFETKARQDGFNQDQINKCLEYASHLFEQNLPIIYDQKHLSLLVGYNEEYLLRAANAPSKFYRNFTLKKKSGGERTISEPLPSLKEIQHWILAEILYQCSVSRFAKAYVPGKSIRENARFHKKQKVVLNLDIKDFFGSLKFGKVFFFFRKLGYSKPVSVMLANLCCLNGALPQGAPTSPAISNLLMHRVDKRISGFALKNNIRYTRYADDITLSGDFQAGTVIRFVCKVLEDENLIINDRKIRARYKHQRQEVTGIVVNEKMQVPRELRKKLRQSVYYIEKFGLVSHLNKIGNVGKANHIHHLLGICNFILFINPKDKEVQNYKRLLRRHLL